MVSVQPPAAGVADDRRRDMRQAAVDEPPVIQFVAQRQGRVVRADIPAGLITERVSTERQVMPAPQMSVIRQSTGKRQGQPVRREASRVMEIPQQGQRQSAARLQVAVTGQAAGIQ